MVTSDYSYADLQHVMDWKKIILKGRNFIRRYGFIGIGVVLLD